MAVKKPYDSTSITTLVCLHDLLGYEELLSAAGGTLDSLVGKAALKRIKGLRDCLSDVLPSFPEGSQCSQFNDSALVCLDINCSIWSHFTDQASVMRAFPKAIDYNDTLKFLGAAAALHNRIMVNEENERLGPAGRTFVILGERWEVSRSARINTLPALQANLAFAEANIANTKGNQQFRGRWFERFYINDYLWDYLGDLKVLDHSFQSPIEPFVSEKDRRRLESMGSKGGRFPRNLHSSEGGEITPIPLDIFYRRREFYSLNAIHVLGLEHWPKGYTSSIVADDGNPTGSEDSGDSTRP